VTEPLPLSVAPRNKAASNDEAGTPVVARRVHAPGTVVSVWGDIAMLYNVHMYVTVRVKVNNIEAGTMREGIEKAEQGTDLAELFPYAVLHRGRIESEFAEEVSAYLVDVVGDDEYVHSKAFDANKNVAPPEIGAKPESDLAVTANACKSSDDVPSAIQRLLANAKDYVDEYVLVSKADIETVQKALRGLGITPREAQAY
jgi:hypothetical protein